jgi:predicted ATP-grasp superfamily ATP-dependent carboligase
MTPVAVVMNLFYTGLGVARSLGERGVSVIGLTSHRRVFGNFTRYAKVVCAPDSRSQADELLPFLLKLGRELEHRAVLFPTRDDDLVFLDRFRDKLEPYFSVVMPRSDALQSCLNKWRTTQWAQRAGVPAPQVWMIEDPAGLERAIKEITYPCVLKPVAAHHWRQGHNWELVGARKVVAITSEAELRSEYRSVAQADNRVLLQEMVSGPDDSLVIVGCYMDKQSQWVAGFNTQKLLQIPEGFGTGCIVQSVERPELFAPTARLLQTMGYSGIAEVEYKFDTADGEYKLIEINPRPWDQHRLGNAAGVDLMYLAYCEHAGLRTPDIPKPKAGHKWIAEDTFLTAGLRSLGRGTPKLGTLLRLARGRRLYAIWSWKDPLPSIVYWLSRYIPDLFGASLRALWNGFRNRLFGHPNSPKKELLYESHIENP